MTKENEIDINDDKLKKALPVDLKKYVEIWEDFYASLISKMMEPQPPQSTDKIKNKIPDDH